MAPRRGLRSLTSTLDSFLFVFAGLSAVWLAYLLLRASLRPNWQVLLLVVFWALVAYLVLPRLHRMLTYLYLPGYFIGRTRTSDGLLGDPVNLALVGDEAQIHAAMTAAGWTRADDVTLASSMRIISTTLSRRSYPEAPVSPLHLFDRQQDFAYQQEVEGNPSQRHHVRFWRCPEGWMLPGGYAVDWLAAGTYDRSVGLSLWTFQVTHRIASDIDVERDYIVASLTGANAAARVDRIRNFSTGYHARNGGGDAMTTDGDLPVLNLRSVEAVEAPAASGPSDSRTMRPAPTVFGAGVALVRGAVIGVVAAMLLLDPTAVDLLPARTVAGTVGATATGLAAMAVLEVGLGLAIYFGRNWARILLMLSCVSTILASYIATAQGGPRPTLGSGLPVVSLGILVLLALTSSRARDFAERRSPVSRPVGGRVPDSAVT
jgi:hypothetical protein